MAQQEFPGIQVWLRKLEQELVDKGQIRPINPAMMALASRRTA